MPRFEANLELIPSEPGVYLMKDADGSVIYVGKAKNLPRRLRSYFTNKPTGNRKVLAMISHIADFSYVVCQNEIEALILENNLIKKYRPRYNVLLRDDKEYPYIKVTAEPFPRVMKVFHLDEDSKRGAIFYGPYASTDLNSAIQALHRIFPIRTCKRIFPRDIGKKRPCLYYHIGRCIGPCTGEVSEEEYDVLIEHIRDFLEGRYHDVLTTIEHKMLAAADDQRFEQAALWRDRLFALRALCQKQVIVSTHAEDFDAIALARNDSEICIQRLEIREGRMIGSAPRFLADQGEDASELVASYLYQHYVENEQNNFIPPLILVPDTEDLAMIMSLLSERAGRKIELRRPQRGDKTKVFEMAEENAKENLRRHTLMGSGVRSLEETLRSVVRELDLDRDLHRIEAFDIANLGKNYRSASMVVFIDGKPKRSFYRQFKLPATEIDDYQAMATILRRRLMRLADEDFGDRPDLILIDGGKGHINSVLPVRDELAPDIAVVGMVKDDKHRSRGLVREDGSILELRQQIDQDHPERAEYLGILRLITAIQDEAHRFANQLYKKQQQQRVLKLSLDEVPGVGKKRREQLLRHFKSVKNIGTASVAELCAVPGISENVAQTIYDYYHRES